MTPTDRAKLRNRGDQAGTRPPAAKLRLPGRLVVLACTGTSLATAGAVAVDAVETLLGGDAVATGLTTLLTVLWITGVSLVGLLLAVRRPENRVGWLFVALGPLLGFVTLLYSYSPAAPRGYEYAFEWLAVVVTWLVLLLAGPTLALIFPDGRLPSPRWGRPVAGVLAIFLVSFVLLTFLPGNLRELGAQNRRTLVDPAIGVAGLEQFKDLLSLGMLGGVFALAALGIAAVVHRRRTGDAVVRAQLAWFLLAIALIPLGMLISMIESVITSDGRANVGPIVLFSGFVLTPVAVAIAILRYRLFDIDIVVRRTLTYGVVSVLLVAVYATAVLVLQPLLYPPTGGDSVAVAASTLLVATLFQPVRSHVQAAVDRRFFRSRYDARQTVARFGARLREEVDLETLGGVLIHEIGLAVQPATASLWLRNVSRTVRWENFNR